MKKILIWGTGCEAEKCIPNIDKENAVILGCIETNPKIDMWKEKKVYSAESIPRLDYDYIIIANIYYDEILGYVKEKGLADEGKLIDWIKVRNNPYYYEKEIWELFSPQFLESNFYVFNTKERKQSANLPEKINLYDQIYIYDLRLADSELHIGKLISNVLDNLKNPRTGMAFIPNEEPLDENWYHNLLFVLDRNALVIWSELEGEFERCIRNNPDKFSFIKFGELQFKRTTVRLVSKGRYMMLDTECVYKAKWEEINRAKKIKIFYLRNDRIGEELIWLNYYIQLERDSDQDIFRLYIPVDTFFKPFEGANACLNEIMGRRINLLKNKEDYALLLQDIFEKSEKYEYDFRWIDTSYPNGIWENNFPDIDFNDDELALGKRLIKNRIGIEGDYVGLFTRDDEHLKRLFPDLDCSYHNYRYMSFDVMDKAIDYFEVCGIRSVRMGQVAERKTVYGTCIDFVGSGYDEFIDLMLHRFCKFFLGTSSGIGLVPRFFGKPVAELLPFYPLINQYAVFWLREELCIFKRIYSVDAQKELSFLEIFDVVYEFETKGRWRGEYFAEHGLQLIPFSRDDVLDLAVEMNEKLDGVWQCRDEDVELHDKFDLLLKEFISKYKINVANMYAPPIATSFLRRYKYLLED